MRALKKGRFLSTRRQNILEKFFFISDVLFTSTNYFQSSKTSYVTFFQGYLIQCPHCLLFKALFCETLPFKTLLFNFYELLKKFALFRAQSKQKLSTMSKRGPLSTFHIGRLDSDDVRKCYVWIQDKKTMSELVSNTNSYLQSECVKRWL